MEEVLSHMLKLEFENGRIGHFYHPRGCPLTSHLLYANNFLVFSNEAHQSLKHLLKILDNMRSGQRNLSTRLSLQSFSLRKSIAQGEGEFLDYWVSQKGIFLLHILELQ